MKWWDAVRFTGTIALLCIMLTGQARQLKMPAADTVKYAPVLQKRLQTRALVPVPANYYSTHLGFFCRQELKLQQAHVPIIFRVGRVEDCNRLEQKPGYR